ncbi:MAG: type II secretion system F family protein [Clostridium sp.]|jgi:type IV pilus assembly protein PilC|uniref:type II secretion system F family protein n=1 Tax=Clostridium sp. TaxID=1506 RepID=UPI0025BA3CBF|nr:type II secretion system F family protein [Clostridium sp.]MCH3964168.1 type II secretion system F family protein [Clostridium sp.]MCI1715349.1 type II secretion system F family protein [Clostridium sp.]MCI1799860.1 type II secretion system F family protein [Clostridium sp.]MCI1813532.1 type II secretion system F family protein [Clostridium sp.]MCI1870678.1 type II secretion system F family protein [Clostridium sp.]
MRIIKYSALNLQGENIKGSCEYGSLDEVKKKFREKGFYIYKTSNKVQWRKILFTRPSFMEISLLCNKINVMMESGIGISKIFMMLERQSNNAALRDALSDIKLQVMQGKSLYSSMKKFSSIFPGYMVEMIGIGEEAGNLEKVLKELSKYYEHQYKIRSGIKSALVYPALTFVISICIIVFLMNNIIPQFINILQSNKAEIPVITKLVISGFDFLKSYFMFITSGVILFMLIVYKFSTSQKGKYILDTVKINIPYFGKLYNEILMFKIASSMRILGISGVNILKSLYITSKTLESSIMNKKMITSIEAVKSGESISSAFEKSGIGNEMFIYMIKTGEEAGKLDYIFNKLEEIFGEDVYRGLKSMVRITEPVIIIFLSFFIGFFIMVAIMPVFNIMDSFS